MHMTQWPYHGRYNCQPKGSHTWDYRLEVDKGKGQLCACKNLCCTNRMGPKLMVLQSIGIHSRDYSGLCSETAHQRNVEFKG